MKRFILGISLCVSLVSTAQEKLKTILCNQNQNVAIVMPASIIQAVTGSENFLFSYNRAKPDSLGLLQGKPGLDSNLLIRTADGKLYNYLLRYKDTLSRFNYFIDRGESILPKGREKDLENEVKEIRFGGMDSMMGATYFDKHSDFYLKKSSGQKKVTVRNNKIQFQVKGISYYKDEVYVVYGLKNNSEIDFEINAIELSKVKGKRNRRSSYQKLEITPIHKFNFPLVISSGQKENFVLVYPKFTMGSGERLKILLTESNGSRYLELLIKSID